MTVAELIAKLSELDQSYDVLVYEPEVGDWVDIINVTEAPPNKIWLDSGFESLTGEQS